MRRLYKPTALFATVISLAFVSTDVLARGPSGQSKKGSTQASKAAQGTSHHQANSTSTSKKAGSITILNSGKGSSGFVPVSHLENTGEGTSGQPHPTGGTGTTGTDTTGTGGKTGTGGGTLLNGINGTLGGSTGTGT